MALKLGSWHPTLGNIGGLVLGLAGAVIQFGQFIPGKTGAVLLAVATAVVSVSHSLIPHTSDTPPSP